MMVWMLFGIAWKDKVLQCDELSLSSSISSAFIEAIEEWGRTDIHATGTRVSAVDFNGDLFIRKDDSGDNFDTDEKNSWLLRNTGAGRFEEVTEASGILQNRTRNTGRLDQVVAVADIDNDGWKDVYLGSTDYPGTRGLLYRQSYKGQFEPVPIDIGVDHTRLHCEAITDFDQGGDLDMVIGHFSRRRA